MANEKLHLVDAKTEYFISLDEILVCIAAGNYTMTMTSRNYGSALEDLSTGCEIKINNVAVNPRLVTNLNRLSLRP